METNNSPRQDNNQDQEPKKSWLERNAWTIALFAAIFIMRMCSELARQ